MYLFLASKQITESRCLQRCLDVSLDVMRQINDLWEPLKRLAPLFNITAKADFLVDIQSIEQEILLNVSCRILGWY
jgi:hypothetical protein